MATRQELTIADRRLLAEQALNDSAFRAHLDQDAPGAIRSLTGVELPGGMEVEILEEEPGLWRFSLPRAGAFAQGLPQPTSTRAAWENEIYSVVRADEDARRELIADPRGFLQRLSGAELPDHRFDVRVETDRQTWIVLDDPSLLNLDELDDDQLDLVAGGGDPGSQDGDITNSRTTKKKEGA